MEIVLLTTALFGVPLFFVTLVSWLDGRKELALKELEVRQLEVQLKLLEEMRLGETPSYIDRKDPVEMDAWNRARAEMAKTVAREL